MNADLTRAAKILIIDDEPDNVFILEKMLRVWGYENLTSTTDARDALGLFQAHRPDFIFLDLMLPHIDGFAVLEQIRGETGDRFLPIVALTADISPQTKKRALAAGASDFLTKPYDSIEVLLRLQNLLQTRFLYLELENQKNALEAALAKTE